MTLALQRKVIKFRWIIILLICIYFILTVNFMDNFEDKPSLRLDKAPYDEFKFILLWTRNDFSPFIQFGSGQAAFIDNNCSVTNCYVTSDRNLFRDNLTKFDAIGFNLPNLGTIIRQELPTQRSPHQKYIVFSYESPVFYPIYTDMFDDFFNWTVGYRLDSDIPQPYFVVLDKNGVTVGPKTDMTWVGNSNEIDADLLRILRGKTKPVAWFVSNCKTPGRREVFVSDLQQALAAYGLSVDVYGECGGLRCARGPNESECDAKLKDYYFYLSLENSFATDYVTEKVLRPLNNDAVPIVYGGANYSRFLPPGSYLQSRSPEELAAAIVRSMRSVRIYSQYFRWRSDYSFRYAHIKEAVCSLCAALNNSTMMTERTEYNNFRQWWSDGTGLAVGVFGYVGSNGTENECNIMTRHTPYCQRNQRYWLLSA